MENNKIDNKYKWDLTKIIKDDNEFDKVYNEVLELGKSLSEYKGKIALNKDNFKSFLELDEKLDRLFTKLYIYANLYCDLDTTNEHGKVLKSKVEKLSEKVNDYTVFVTPELLSNDIDVYFKFIEEDKSLEKYRFEIEQIFRYKKHTLSIEEENIINQSSNALGVGSEVFYNLDNSDIRLGNIICDGKEVELTNSNYIKFLSNKDRNVRIQAFQKLYEYFANHKNTLAACLKGNVKENWYISKVRGYKSPLSQSLYADSIDESVYTNLIDTVHKNLNLIYDFMEVRRKALNLDELHMYDIFVNLSNEIDKDIPFEEGKKIVLEALKPLGDKYINDLSHAFTDGWIDAYPSRGKKSGAYQWGCYDTTPYVLLNYENTVDDVSTMAHELGHAMHSYYSNENQDYIYSNYPIFLAEIASTVNEILLNEYLYRNATSREDKITYLVDFLDKVRTTIVRQTMFAEFEKIIHEKENEGVPLTSEKLCNIYYDLNKLYFGPNVVSDEEIKYEWSRIPHFYTSFYVYKYATGLSSAIALASNILDNKPNAKEAYLEFLSSGGKDYPLNILKKAGVDMTNPESIQISFDLFSKKLEELKTLL